MHNRFKHTGVINLPDGPQWPYAFGPNQSAILCELMNWEFWEHEEKVLPALYEVVSLAEVVTNEQATMEERQEAAVRVRRSLFNNPTFMQNFFYSAVRFGHELEGLPVDFTPAVVGMWWNEQPDAFKVILTHLGQQMAERVNMAAARPTAAPRAGEVKKPAAPKRKKKAA